MPYGVLQCQPKREGTMPERRMLLSTLVGFLMLGALAAIGDLAVCRARGLSTCDSQQNALAAATAGAAGTILGILTRQPD